MYPQVHTVLVIYTGLQWVILIADFWAAVMLRPELSGGIPQYAVIIEAEDSGDYRDAMSRQGFIPLSPDILSRYIAPPGSFASFAGTTDAKVYNRRILNSYR